MTSPAAVLLVLSRYPDLFTRFRESVDILAPDTFKILIRSGTDIHAPDDFRWLTRQGKEPFIYSRNVNLGWSTAPFDDVCLCGDDIHISTPGFIDILRSVAYSDPAIGISTIQLYGQSPFVCGYFKRSVLTAVGPMDERFTGYGHDDNDWCRRMESLGYRTQPTDLITATHGGGTSFLRRARELNTSMEALSATNDKLYADKWEDK